MNYVTLYQFKSYRFNEQTTTTDDARILEMIERASQFIDDYKGRRFDVRVQTRKYDRPVDRGSAFGVYDISLMGGSGPEKPLRLKEDLLAVTELVNGDGTVIPSTDYVLEPANGSPKTRIRLINGANWCGDDDGNDEQVIDVTGFWGYHDRYSQAWVSSGDKITNLAGITAEAASMTVADADGVAADLKTPRFQVGQLIRMGTELCLVLSVDTATNTVGLVRAYNGSTAAIHAKDVVIDIFRPMGNIVQACMRLTSWFYVQKDADVFDRTYNMGTGIVSTPTAMPGDVLKLLGAPKVGIP
jgi:hypothetical protein